MGITVIPFLPIDLVPDYKPPRLTISYNLSNSPPFIVEQEATAIFENLFSQVTELNEINSESSYNSGRIELIFDRDADIDFKKFEVSSLIKQVYPTLNRKLSYPSIKQASSTQKRVSPLLTYRINAPYAPFQIQKIANEIIKTKVSLLENINEVLISGAQPLQITVEIDQSQLTAYKISKSAVLSGIRESYSSQYLGSSLESNQNRFYVKTINNLKDLEDLQNLVVINNDGTAIPLKRLARIYIEESEARSYLRINGLNSISIAIYADDGINKLDLARKIKTEISSISKSLPTNYELAINYDDSEFIEKELNKIYKRSIISIGILLLFTIIIYRKISYLLILTSGLIVNILLCILIIWFLNIQVHLYTLAGITISFGLIVDNAIVMLDHYYRKKNLKVFLALLAASLTTIFALLSINLLPFETRKNLTEFSSVIAVNLVVSLIISLLYTPAIFHLTHQNRKIKPLKVKRLKKIYSVISIYGQLIFTLSRFKKALIFVLVLSFGLPVFLLPNKWEGHELYNSTIGSDYYQEDIKPYSDKILGGSLRLFTRNVFEKYSYRTPQKTRLFVNGKLPYGSTLKQINIVFEQVEDFLQDFDGIETFVTNIYSAQNGRIEINFTEQAEKAGIPYLLKNKLTSRSIDWGGVTWSIYGVGKGYSNQTGGNIANFRVEMTGYNLDELNRQVTRMADSLIVHPRIKTVDKDLTMGFNNASSSEYVLNIDKNALAQTGNDLFQVQNTFQDFAKPVNASTRISITDQSYLLYIKEKESDSFSNYEVLNRSFPKPEGEGYFKLRDFASFDLKKINNTIFKKNRQYIKVLGFDYLGSYKFGSKYLDTRIKEFKTIIPLGYSINTKDFSFWGNPETKKQYGLLVIIIIGIYFICAISFESLKLPFYVLLAVPFSFIGLFLTFGLFDLYFDQGGYAAFLMLVGLSVNAMIFIIQHYQNLNSVEKASNLIRSVSKKASPILLTILSTCLGLIPFIIEGQEEVFWFSFAVGTIGGLIFSMVGIFLFIPALMIRNAGKSTN